MTCLADMVPLRFGTSNVNTNFAGREHISAIKEFEVWVAKIRYKKVLLFYLSWLKFLIRLPWLIYEKITSKLLITSFLDWIP